MKRLLLLAALCACASAMIARPRRAVNTDEMQQPSTAKNICAVSTPCGWIFYTLFNKDETHEPNQYCQCDPKMICAIDEHDQSALTWIKRCKLPKDVEKTEDSEKNTESEKNAES